MSFFLEHLLKKPLTVVDQFHSHLEPMKFIRRDLIADQVSRILIFLFDMMFTKHSIKSLFASKKGNQTLHKTYQLRSW